MKDNKSFNTLVILNVCILIVHIGIFAVVYSSILSLKFVWSIPYYGKFIIINTLLSIFTTIVVVISKLSKVSLINTVLVLTAISLIVDLVFTIGQVSFSFSVAKIFSIQTLVLIAHTYLMYVIIHNFYLAKDS